MKFSLFVPLSLTAVLATQLAEARVSSEMVRKSIAERDASAGRGQDGHLHDLSKKDDTAASHQHRRHHESKKVKRACSADSPSSSTRNTSGSGSSTSGTNTVSDSDSNSDSTSSSSSSASNARGTSRTSSKYVSGNNSTSSSDTSSGGSSSVSSSSGTSSSSGSVSGFSGTNTGIGSWFRTDSSQDSTNGRSWCQLNYQDSWMGFAPDVSVMLKSGDTATAGKAYCGREAKATNPKNGKSALIYIVDGFDPKWVKTPGSIDLTVAAFTALYGSFDGNKNTVIMDLEWHFTDNVKEEYTFNSGS